MNRFRTARRAASLLVAAGSAAVCASAIAAVPREPPVAGQIVVAKGDEELQFVGEPLWRDAEVEQQLLGGDRLRTGALGSLAILFADQTQIRVQSNSELLVREIDASGPTALQLDQGAIWARAAVGGGGVVVDTPAATAAIRGTDWSLAVDENGDTRLVVLDGAVELANPQGSVTVRRGEVGLAAVGEAPTKILLVTPDDREQMLFYFSLADAFSWLPSSPLDRREMPEVRARMEAIPAAQRDVEDWLTRAEIALAFDDRDIAAEALQEVRRAGALSSEQRARADLVEGLLAGRSRDFARAAALLRSAEAALEGRRRLGAAYGRYFAELLEDPSKRPQEPADPAFATDPYDAVVRAWLAGFRGDFEEADRILAAADETAPPLALIPALRGQIAILFYRPEDLERMVARAQSIDADDPATLLLTADYHTYVTWDMDEAADILLRAAEIAPGDGDVWNTLGLVRSEQDAPREAEAAFLRAIAAEPENPVPYANYAIFLLDEDRLEEARQQIERAMALDPSFYYGLLAEGRYLLQRGDSEGAREKFLAAVVANPGLSNSTLATAIEYYQSGEVERALQALDNADRLDPHDPIIPLVATVIAIDRYQADAAIVSAREAIERYRTRGGIYNPLAASREGGSYLSEAFELLDLSDWGRYTNDLIFNPFDASAFFGEAAVERNTAFSQTDIASGAARSAAIQGLLLEPLAVSSRSRYTDLFRRPFVDGIVGAGIVTADDRSGWQADAELDVFDNSRLPVALFASAAVSETDGPEENDDAALRSFSTFAGVNLTPADRLLLWSLGSDGEIELPGQRSFPTPEDKREGSAMEVGIGYSHTFGFRNVVTAAALLSRTTVEAESRRIGEIAPGFDFDLESKAQENEDALLVGASHTVGLGKVALRYGAEARPFVTDLDSRVRSTFFLFGTPLNSLEELGEEDDTGISGRIYADATVQATDDLRFEIGGYWNYLDNDAMSRGRLDPRLGAAWSPADGHWLRLAYIQDMQLPSDLTLAPTTTVGLLPGAAPQQSGGRVESLTARWDAEWSSRIFTAVEVERLHLTDLSFAVPDTLTSLDVERGRIDRITLSANAWVGGGVGLFGSVTLAHSDNRSGDGNDDEDLPYVPERSARFGVTWVHPSQVRLSIEERLVGDRAGTLDGEELDAFATTNASVTWQSYDRHLELGLTVENLLDEDYERGVDVPAAGRSVLVTGRVRF